MRISTFFYTIKQGLVNIWKNKMFSLASIATMTACIFSVWSVLFDRDQLPGDGKGCGIRCCSHSIF